MILFPAIVIIGVIVGAVLAYRADNSIGSVVAGSVFGFLAGAFFGTMSMFIAMTFATVDTNVHYDITAIADLDTTLTSGSGFIFISIDSESVSYYNYFYRDGEAIRRGKINADSAVIIERENVSPSIEGECEVRESSWFYIAIGSDTTPSSCEYTIIVPSGSVTNEFNLDLE